MTQEKKHDDKETKKLSDEDRKKITDEEMKKSVGGARAVDHNSSRSNKG